MDDLSFQLSKSDLTPRPPFLSFSARSEKIGLTTSPPDKKRQSVPYTILTHCIILWAIFAYSRIDSLDDYEVFEWSLT